jgi:NAD(P)H-hydrate epimerase
VGVVEVLPIGLPDGTSDAITLELADADMAAAALPQRRTDGHKGSFGHVLVVAGSRRFIGAPVLAATAAYRSGAGLVTLAAPEGAYRLAAAMLLEQVHLPLAETPDGHVSAEAAAVVRGALEGATASVIGPGLGNVESVRQLLEAVLLTEPALDTPGVIDADALNGLASTYGWWERLTMPAVLTPHAGEMSRLMSRSVSAIQHDRLDTALEAAIRWQQVVVLKGAHTIVASPDGRAAISPFANPALAAAGTGDVLAGIVGGLLAQGVAPYDAAVAGVHVHAEAAHRIGGWSSGLLASDLLLEIPRAMHGLRYGLQ